MNVIASLRALGRPFLLMWAGQTISMVGSAIAGFAFGVWIFQGSGKVLDFAGMAVISALPGLLITPWAGSVADRVDRRYVILAADTTAALSTAVVAFLLWQGTLEIWHLYVISLVGATAGAFQGPAYHALAASVLPKDDMPRANGLMEMSSSLIEICAPMAAGALMGYIGLPAIVLMDLVTFCIGAAIVFKVFSALAPLSMPAPQQGSVLRSALSDFLEALRFFKTHVLMLGLVGYMELQGCLLGFVTILIAPLVLSSHSATDLGMVMTAAGVGGLVGSGYLVIAANPARLMVRVLACDAVISACVVIAGFYESVHIYAACSFLAAMAGAASGGYAGALWMRKVPTAQQGRIFAATSLVSMITGPVVALVGGFLADRVFEPALAPQGSMAASLGHWFGTGKGRGLGLMFVICGGACLVASLLALTNARLRNLDRFVPDAT